MDNKWPFVFAAFGALMCLGGIWGGSYFCHVIAKDSRDWMMVPAAVTGIMFFGIGFVACGWGIKELIENA